MEIVRTSRGTNSSKTSSTTLTISDVPSDGLSLMVVGVTWDDAVASPTVAHGTHDIPFTIRDSGGGNGISTAIFARQRVSSGTKTKDMVVTWPSAVTAKAMFVTQFVGPGPTDFVLSNAQAAVTATNAGIATATSYADTACVVAFGSEGPVEDAGATALLGYTLGQRDGTTGNGAASNITIQETYKILTAIESTRGRLEVDTARDFTNCIATFSGHREHTVGVTPTDLYVVENIFEEKDPALNVDDLVFTYNHYAGRWEAYDVADVGTLIAYQNGDWTEV